MSRATWGWGLAAAVVVLLLLINAASPRARGGELSLTDFTSALRSGQVQSANVQFENNTAVLSGKLKDSQEYSVRTLAADPVIALNRLQAAGVSVTYVQPARLSFLALFSGLLTGLLIVGLLLLLFRNRQGGGTDAASNFGKSKAA
ncbi:ATP-dependent metalloprotease FtsH, partial [Deinococcus aerius]